MTVLAEPIAPAARGQDAPATDRPAWLGRYCEVRDHTLQLARPLSAEDQQVQSMPDVSPTKWHLAHTTWFFETFLLSRQPVYRVFDPAYGFLFNSYYETVGARHPRPERGLLSRPSLEEVTAYRAHVDEAMQRLIADCPDADWAGFRSLVELGLNHEQQHQELILMDIKHVLSVNPLQPAYAPVPADHAVPAETAQWIAFDGGLVEIGVEIGRAGQGFVFDNETPRHKLWLEPFRLQDRLATAGEWAEFIAAGGYRQHDLWLSEGWAAVQREDWRAPLYWQEDGSGWSVFTLHGRHPIEPDAPVRHVSFYEADAYARWRGLRLPTEAEWEAAAVSGARLRQMSGEAWQWTATPYVAYPRFRAAAGALGEYNGKFMSNQMVLRGGAAETPAGHSRTTYRNFFPPAARWEFSGVRLADDL